jgi:ComEC/Rec2-related protein
MTLRRDAFPASPVNARLSWALRLALLLQCSPVSSIASALTLLSAIFYSALAGFAIPTQRALLMLSICSLAILQRRHITSWHSFNLALLIILILEPFAVLSASFWLSFMAVTFIFYAVSNRIKPLKNWRAWCRIQSMRQESIAKAMRVEEPTIGVR